MALVPYVENPLPALSKLHNSSARFRFADHDLRLSQDWKKLGVAAVVWDAVSHRSPATLLLSESISAGHLIDCVSFPGSGHVHVPGAGEGGVKGEGGD